MCWLFALRLVLAYTTSSMTELLTQAQVCELAKVSRWTVRREVRDGHLAQVLVRGRPRYSQRDVERWVAHMRQRRDGG